MLRMLPFCEDQPSQEVRAHSAEITDIAICQIADPPLCATASRDRTVQLFCAENGSLDILQTIDDHVGAVNNVLFTNKGQRLVTGSADRTVIIHERITRDEQNGIQTSPSFAFLPSRIITLKASPMSLAVLSSEPDWLFASTMNHQLVKLDMTTGRQLHAFKATDPDNNDLVVLNNISTRESLNDEEPRIIAGVSSTDKSIRVYDLDTGELLGRDFGHSEGVTDIGMLEMLPTTADSPGSRPATTVVTTGQDGTIMLWDLSLRQSRNLRDVTQGRPTGADCGTDADGTPMKEPVALRQPLRRVLSRSELAEYMVLDPTTPGSPSAGKSAARSTRNPSPTRNLRRRTSRQSLMVSRPSPSPPPSSQRPSQSSPTDHNFGKDNRKRSPSPPTGASSPHRHNHHIHPSPRTPNRANNGRLRRPPSIPSNLRTLARTKSNDVSATLTETDEDGACSPGTGVSVSKDTMIEEVKQAESTDTAEGVDIDSLTRKLCYDLKLFRDRVEIYQQRQVVSSPVLATAEDPLKMKIGIKGLQEELSLTSRLLEMCYGEELSARDDQQGEQNLLKSSENNQAIQSDPNHEESNDRKAQTPIETINTHHHKSLASPLHSPKPPPTENQAAASPAPIPSEPLPKPQSFPAESQVRLLPMRPSSSQSPT